MKLAFLGLAFQVSHAMQPLSDLLQQEAQDEKSRRTEFEEWCQGQLSSESSQRDAMKHLHDRVAPLVSDGTHLSSLSQQVSTLAKQLEKRETEAASATTVKSRVNIDLEDAKRDVHTLSKVQSKLAGKVKGTSFLQAAKDGPLGAVVDLLRSAKAREQSAADEVSEPARLQKEAGELRAEYEKRSTELAQLQTKQLAAETSRDLLFSAVEDEDGFVADLQDICALGKDVFKRYEQDVQPAFQAVAKQIAKFGAKPASAAAPPATTQAPTSTQPPPPASTTTPPPPPPPSTTPPPAPTTTSTSPTTTPAPPTTTPAPATTTEAPATGPPTTKVHHHKHHTTTTLPPTTTTALPTTTFPPPPADLDDDDDSPATPAPKHKHHKKTTTAAPADMDDTFKDDDDAAPAAKPKKATALVEKVTSASAESTLDPDDDSLPPPSPKHMKKASPHNPAPPPDADDDDDMSTAPVTKTKATAQAAPPDADDDDDSSSAPPPPAKKAAKKAAPATNNKNQFLQDMYASAAGRMPSQYAAWSPGAEEDVTATAKKTGTSAVDDFKKQLDSDDDDDDAPAKKKSKHHKHVVEADYDSDTPSPPPLHDLDGGLEAAIRGGPSKGSKKHQFTDDTSSIMSIIQQPKDYSAWSPDKQDKGSMGKAANVDLKAAEAAFDSDFLQLGSETHQGVASIIREVLDNDESDDAGAMIFLERSSTHVEAMGVDASSVILEQYGSALESPPLLELAHARLSMSKLNSLWRKVQKVDTSTAADEHAHTEAQWCRDFQKKALAKADAQRVARDGASAELLQVEAQLTVTNQDAAAVKQVSEAFAAETKRVQIMQARVQHQFDSANAIVKRLESEVSALGAQAGAVQLKVGQLQGTVLSGSAEMGDIIRATVARRSAAEQARKESAAQLQTQSKSLSAKRDVLVKVVKAQDEASTAAAQGSDDHYKQMCKWVLDDAEVKERKQAAEKNAIHSAFIVLKAH